MAEPSRATILEQILQSPQRVVVLTSPARGGKTAAILDLYRHAQDGLGSSAALLVVPNSPAQAYLKKRLLDESPHGILLCPALTTFSALAGRILGLAGKPAYALSAVRRHLLLERILRDLCDAKALKVLGGLVDSPGLVGALDTSIAELKRAAVAPEDLEKAIDPASAKDADLLAVYRAYQQHLLANNRFDTEGLLWLARDVLRDDPAAGLGGQKISLLAVDGFIDFTPTQMEMLALLSRRVDKTVITLPWAAEPARGRLWQWTDRTLQRVRAKIPDCGLVTLDGPGAMSALFDLAVLSGQAGTAASAQSGDSGPAGPEVTILAAGSVEAEVRAAARAVKAKLVAGAGAGDIAVLARNLDSYAEPIERIFSAHDIPVARRPMVLAENNLVRFLLRLLSLPGRYDCHDVLAIIKNSYFNPAALGAFTLFTAATAEMAIRHANVLQGRQAYAQALQRLAVRAAMHEQDSESEGLALGPLLAKEQHIVQAGELLEALFVRLDKLAAARSAPEYAQAVRELIAAMDLPAAATRHESDRMVAMDLRGIQAVDRLLDELAESGMACADAEGYTQLLSRLAGVSSLPQDRSEALVSVLDVTDARAMQFVHVVLLGVNEKAFPHLASERCFIDESDRSAWLQRGLQLDRRSDLVGREMLLFYLAASRAGRTLHVSYTTADANGSTSAPSAFIEELALAATAQRLELIQRHISPGELVPPVAELSCRQDVLHAAILAAFDPFAPEPAIAKPLLGYLAMREPQRLSRACGGIFATTCRWRPGEVDRFDGRISDGAARTALAHRLEGWVFSASEFNAFAQCPWQFFARYLLHLRPLEDPQASLTPVQRGSFFHAVLWGVMTQLRGRHGSPVNLSGISDQELEAALDEAVEGERQRMGRYAQYEQLWLVQTQAWRKQLWAYLQQQKDASGPTGGCLYFELAFGAGLRASQRTDPASVKDPVTVHLGGRSVQLQGVIDRVDVDDQGQLVVVDYKSGLLPRKEIRQGLDLQLALYSQAVEAIFGQPCAGGGYHDVRKGKHSYFTRSRMGRAAGDERGYEQVLQDALAQAGRYLQDMQAGRFDDLPAKKCPSYCPFARICHFSEPRSQRKTGGHRLIGPAEDGDDE